MTEHQHPARSRATIGQRIAPPRFLLFLVLLPLTFFAYRWLTGSDHLGDSAAMAFDVAAVVFIGSLVPLFRRSGADVMRRHSAANDTNRRLVLILTALIATAVMAAMGGELESARTGDLLAGAKLLGTVLLAWLFANFVFTLHYAHAWYTRASGGGDTGGLDFPETPEPTYADFAYFALTLGMTFQTSDVGITSTRMRRLVLAHSFGAFLFNIGVIAFAINVLGG